MIEATNLTKRYGAKTAVNDISFSLQPGQVIGFLGPNGAGKSTTMRMLMGLDRPTSGSITVMGKPYAEHRNPLSVAGALLDAKGVHPGRSARSHLRALAATHSISDTRVNKVLELTGLESVAHKRIGGFSLGMGQRLGIATALLGDPQVLVLDEPVNGLDPDGVLWVREFVRAFAAEGRTVLLSSHLMSEMAQTADHVLVLGRGALIADAPIAQLIAAGGGQRTVRVVSPQSIKLGELLRARGARSTQQSDCDELLLDGITAAEVGEVAAANGIVLHALSTDAASLEEAYLELTRGELEYAAA
ncbi:ABC transporter ATP-binding protein [Leucobacter sp. UT-8R-CII-1-4]|uniref:ABC transporter ATP-binding protein n=1 Tax=Leucobacter sp. UT-8R-CII-1-4 TaxID=3040075 RepID=UPI0024A8D0CA|nr:ABC transporter ATP-binding protein [Leucobacter sp. UT-8R-CII-1-4]MDI6023050.1 ABC transporter ATP-binding protein [Leucobacter sp. UT-8R-CII-1-4]